MRKGRTLFFASGLVIWSLLVAGRIYKESQSLVRSKSTKQIVGTDWDPRDRQLIDKVARLRESESFRNRLRRGLDSQLFWPGTKAAQVSWTWLELLQGLHNEASYEGDFSWMFSKLHTVALASDPREIRFLASLAPFFFVIGKDHAGANVLMQEVLDRAPGSWQAWFWSGFHAYENLSDRKLAADLYERAARIDGSPAYFAALSVRLKLGLDFPKKNIGKAFEGQMDPELLERVRQARPEYFDK
jgi:hypothetical protein